MGSLAQHLMNEVVLKEGVEFFDRFKDKLYFNNKKNILVEKINFPAVMGLSKDWGFLGYSYFPKKGQIKIPIKDICDYEEVSIGEYQELKEKFLKSKKRLSLAKKFENMNKPNLSKQEIKDQTLYCPTEGIFGNQAIPLFEKR